MDSEGKKGSFLGIFIAMIVSLGIAFYWDKLPIIKNSVESVLNPTFGALIQWNNLLGFLIIVALITLILTLAQKFLTDQEEMKKLKKEQKSLQEEMKKYKDHPEKFLELQKESIKLIMPMMTLSMRPLAYTAIPIILFFRWFQEILDPIYGSWWIFYYILASIIFSSIFRKMMNVA